MEFLPPNRETVGQMLCISAGIFFLGSAVTFSESREDAPNPERNSTPSVQSQTTGQIFLEAERAFGAHDYDRVITLMDRVIAGNVDNVKASAAIMNRGNAYGAKGDLVKAIADLDQALNLNPSNAEAYRYRAVALVKNGDQDGAMKDLTEAIRFNPRAWQPFLMRAKISAAQHDAPAALDDLNKAIELNPKSAEGYSARAWIYLRMGEKEKALSDVNRAIQLDPNSVSGYTCRLNVDTRTKRYREAEDDLHTLAGLQPKAAPGPWNSIAWFRATCQDEQMRNGSEAISAGKKACDLTSWKDYHCLDSLAAAYAEVADFDQAIANENRALEAVKPGVDETEMRKRLSLYQKQQPYRDELKP